MRTPLAVALLALASCAGRRLAYVREKAAQDMVCPEEQISAEASEKIENLYYARGCGKSFVCVQDLNGRDKYDCRPHEGPTP